MHKARIDAQSFIIAILFFVFAFNVYLIGARLLPTAICPKHSAWPCGGRPGSMEPTVNVGDILIIGNSRFVVGDIVTYRSGASLVTHRIVADQGDLLVNRGDHTNVDDAPIPPERVEGKMIVRIPMLGKLSLCCERAQGFL
jgi:signal peptidase I